MIGCVRRDFPILTAEFAILLPLNKQLFFTDLNRELIAVIHHFKCNFQVAGQPGIPVVLSDANAMVAINVQRCSFYFFALAENEIIVPIILCSSGESVLIYVPIKP